MFLVGLTGGIAAGKSTVAKRWQELGAIEIDADQLAREVVEPGTQGLSDIIREFGSEVIAADGTLDRSKLGAVVFNDPTQLAKLNGIVHPLVQARTRELIATAPNDAIVVYNVPLMVEADVDHPFDFVVTVEAPEEAQSRIRAQASPIERANNADRILNSNQSLGLLIDDADALYGEIEKLAAKKAGN